ncbi:MAG: protein phosphatase 2C domain-containing protein, partial [Rubricoccaceae bacterium]|nr:protein phosphatase 2C domain-containing protein [Rubricoccaceae bacterium]
MPFLTGRPLSKRGGRANNQDATAFAITKGMGCWVLADGLGGHSAGEIASRSAVDAVINTFNNTLGFSDNALRHYIRAAQKAVHEQQKGESELESMKTTITILVATEGLARWTHVGDSRLYAFRHGRVNRQTDDHSVPQALVESGEIRRDEIREHPDRNRLLRALGKPGEPKPEVGEAYYTGPGDAFLLCSDGFWEYVLETEMEEDLTTSNDPNEWLER